MQTFLLVSVLVLMIAVMVILIVICFLLIKLADQLGELWEVIHTQGVNIRRLMNWAGGVPHDESP